jgi:hypothetical protein
MALSSSSSPNTLSHTSPVNSEVHRYSWAVFILELVLNLGNGFIWEVYVILVWLNWCKVGNLLFVIIYFRACRRNIKNSTCWCHLNYIFVIIKIKQCISYTLGLRFQFASESKYVIYSIMFVALLTGSGTITWRMIYGMNDSFGCLYLWVSGISRRKSNQRIIRIAYLIPQQLSETLKRLVVSLLKIVSVLCFTLSVSFCSKMILNENIGT